MIISARRNTPYRLLGNKILHDLWLLPQPNVKGISDNDTFETYVSFAEQKIMDMDYGNRFVIKMGSMDPPAINFGKSMNFYEQMLYKR